MNTSGERKAALKKLKNLFFSAKSEVKEYREKMDSTFGDVFLPNRVEVSERDFGGVQCDVLSPEIYNSRRVMIYIHGGCFVGGSRKSSRPFAAALANAVSCRAVVPEFRLAPTHSYPASLEDVQTVFRTIYTEELVTRSLDRDASGQPVKPEFIIMADGSGASIAMALVYSLADRYRETIRGIFLFSPWLDVSGTAKNLNTKKAADELVSGEAIRRAAELYTYQDNRNIPLVSPLKADKSMLQGIPPVYIQMGDKELGLEDAEQFYIMLKEAGNDATLDVWPDMMSMFQLADDYLEESHLAIERIGKIFSHREVTEADSQLKIGVQLETKENYIKHGE